MTGMRVAPGIEITPERLIESNLPDADYPAYDPGETYGVGDRVTIDRINYEALAENSGRHPVTDTETPPAWLNLGWVNKYRMFNKSIGNTWAIGTFTSNPEVIDFTVRPGRRINSIGMVGVVASSVQIVMTIPDTEEVIYDKTFAMSSKAGGSWYQYYFGPFTTRSNLADFELPPANNADIRVIVNAPGGVARVGMMVIGWGKSIGVAAYGTTLGRKSYSTIKEDFDGSLTITRRGRRRHIDFRVEISGGHISSAERTLDDLSDIPALYAGSSDLGYTVIIGIFEDFDLGLPTYNLGEYTLRVRSIT